MQSEAMQAEMILQTLAFLPPRRRDRRGFLPFPSLGVLGASVVNPSSTAWKRGSRRMNLGGGQI
jgi:hypothetical protein